MVSTRRNSGSLSAKRPSSSSDDKPPSPSSKRQKGDSGGSGGASEKPVTAAEDSKELRAPEAAADPGECGTANDAQIAGNDGKADVPPAVPVAAPIADGSTPSLVADKPKSSFSSWFYQKQNPNSEGVPWCRLLSQSSQNPNVPISTSNFTIGSSRNSNFPLKDHTASGTLCKIKQSQREGNAVAVLESTGSKGSVLVNGTLVKKSTSCVLNSGDEVVFGLLGNHAYVSFSVNSS